MTSILVDLGSYQESFPLWFSPTFSCLDSVTNLIPFYHPDAHGKGFCALLWK
jgi:hypothetical protein